MQFAQIAMMVLTAWMYVVGCSSGGRTSIESAPIARTPPSAPVGLTSTSTQAAGVCGLDDRFVHRTRSDGDRVVLHGDGALLFRARYAINTDGAPTSYHPDDPFGEEGLAINTICNGATAYTAKGEKVGFRECGRLVSLFKRARKAGWGRKRGHPYVRFYGVATSDPNGHVPCIVRSGAFAGYFVSMTRLSRATSAGPCDPSQYLDSLAVPFIIVPRRSKLAEAGMGVRDLAVVFEPKSGRMVFAVVGDVGPTWGLGEGSVAVAQKLTGRTAPPRTRKELYGFLRSEVVTLVLTDATASDPHTPSRIELDAAAALARFGGIERLKRCMAVLEQDRHHSVRP